MIRMTVLYPETEGTKFDHDYYREVHIPLCLQSWKPVSTEINRGVSGPFVAAVHFLFESVDDMNAALAGEGTGAVMADVANYTDIQPVIQTFEIV